MIRVVRAFAVAALLLATSSGAQQPGAGAAPPGALDSLRKATVGISVTTSRGLVTGSGLVLWETPGGITLVATAAHLLRGASGVRVVLATGRTVRIEGLLDLDPRRDFALLAVAGLHATEFATADDRDSITVGLRTIVLVAARATSLRLVRGSVAATEEGVADAIGVRGLLRLTTRASAGSAGAPVATDDGRVIGIAVAPPAVRDSAAATFVATLDDIGGQAEQFEVNRPVSLADALDLFAVHPWDRTETVPPTVGGAAGPPPRDTTLATVRVFFATDRKPTGKTAPDEMFGGERGDEASPFTYGTSVVSFPATHRKGEIERPSLLKLQFGEDAEKHVVVENVTTVAPNDFFRQLGERVRASSKKSAFVFVHGYNVSFVEAARRTAQIAYDIAFDGAPVFYSWPSQGSTAKYTVDEQNIEWSQPNVRMFLDDFLTRSTAEEVYIIAHSMGNRAATRAVAALLNEKPALRKRIKEVILAAPDIDASVFKRDIAPALQKTGRPVTLYVSSEDEALKASKAVHGFARAGDAGPTLVVVPGVETIDASGLDRSLLGHSYFAETGPVLADIMEIIRVGARAEQRRQLAHIWTTRGYYWKLRTP